MKALFLLLALGLASCSRYSIMTMNECHVLIKDGNLNKTKARIENDIFIEPVVKDTVVSKVDKKGTATFTTITRTGMTIEKGTKGKFYEEDGNIYFEFDDSEYKRIVGALPIKEGKETYYIRTQKLTMIGTRLNVDNNDPGFSIKMKRKRKEQKMGDKR
jgi:hypothetical protein